MSTISTVTFPLQPQANLTSTCTCSTSLSVPQDWASSAGGTPDWLEGLRHTAWQAFRRFRSLLCCCALCWLVAFLGGLGDVLIGTLGSNEQLPICRVCWTVGDTKIWSSRLFRGPLGPCFADKATLFGCAITLHHVASRLSNKQVLYEDMMVAAESISVQSPQAGCFIRDRSIFWWMDACKHTTHSPNALSLPFRLFNFHSPLLLDDHELLSCEYRSLTADLPVICTVLLFLFSTFPYPLWSEDYY